MQTKAQQYRYNLYRDFVRKSGCKSIYQHYNSCSTKKACAWQNITVRKCDEDGFAFTIVNGGSHFFSTGYLRYVKDGVELVYDYKSSTDRILLTDEQRLELSKILCRTI